mmetsp:Transcript_1597/g.5452  ORF Transcript_1597/g.5452 Transcript_1597/m.5452 type:complete len:219 (+) Transcript_1597:1423-2079(+)
MRDLLLHLLGLGLAVDPVEDGDRLEDHQPILQALCPANYVVQKVLDVLRASRVRETHNGSDVLLLGGHDVVVGRLHDRHIDFLVNERRGQRRGRDIGFALCIDNKKRRWGPREGQQVGECVSRTTDAPYMPPCFRAWRPRRALRRQRRRSAICDVRPAWRVSFVHSRGRPGCDRSLQAFDSAFDPPPRVHEAWPGPQGLAKPSKSLCARVRNRSWGFP